MSILDYALKYAESGIPVFPVHGITLQGVCTCQKTNCPHPGKHPILSGGFKNSSIDANTIITWWNSYPSANIGIPTGSVSGLYVVDIDYKHNGIENYRTYKDSRKDDIPNASLISSTGGGGFHLVYKSPSNGVEVKSATNIGSIQGVDFRGERGYIVAPPSLHVSQKHYRWRNDSNFSGIETINSLLPLPLAIVDLVNNKPLSIGAVSTVVEGGRNDYLFKKACTFRKQGAVDNELYDVVWAENLSTCKPPLYETEVQQIVSSALSYDITPSSSPASNDNSSSRGVRENAFDIFMRITQEHEFWVDNVKRQYVTYFVKKGSESGNGHFENWPIKSPEYCVYLSHQYRLATNKTPSKSSLEQVVTGLAGDALFNEKECDTYVRTARQGERLFVDLSNKNWDVIEVTKDGWSLVEGIPPVKFLRSKNSQPLPMPDPTGTFDCLKEIFRLKNDDDYILLAAWMVYVLAGKGPYPILAIEGTAGSSKSTLTKQLRMLLDPRKPSIQSMPRNIDDLYINSNSSHLIAIDNLSKISQNTSDILCGIATGTGTSKRELYTDSDEVYFEVCKPIIFNSINPVIESPDLADRSLRLSLKPIERLSKEKVDELFDSLAPKIIGATLTAISTALPIYSRVKDLPPEIRMIDFAQWAVAAGDALATNGRSFVSAFMANHFHSNLPLLEENVLYSSLLDFLKLKGSWVGSATELLAELKKRIEPHASSHATFPSIANQLTRELNKGVTTLKLFGIEYSHSGDGNHKKRLITLQYSPELEVGESSNDEWGITIEPQTFEDDSEGIGWPEPIQNEIEEQLQDRGIEIYVVDNTDMAFLVLKMLNKQSVVVGLDVETTGLNPHHDKLCLIQLFNGKTCYIFDVLKMGAITELADEFSKLKAVAHNAVFDMKFLQKNGVTIKLDCTLLVQHILTGEMTSLKELAKDYLDIELDKSEQSSDWASELTKQQLNYAAKDAEIVFELYQKMVPILKERDLINIYNIVKDAQPFVVDMQLNGMGINQTNYQLMLEQLKVKHQNLLKQWESYSQGMKHSSASQLSIWIEQQIEYPDAEWPKTKNGSYSTTTQDLYLNKHYLKESARVALETILFPLKKLDKQVTSFGDKFLDFIDSQTNRLHPSFHLAGTKTGRLSCSKPNLQQIPNQNEYRELFTAAQEHKLIIADYSQMELRVAAILANETILLDAYEQGQDTHQLTAALLLGKEPEDITKEERQLAKAVNFGLLYGQGAVGLQRYAQSSYGVDISFEEARSYRESWFASYPSIARWHQLTLQQAKHDMLICTPSGRKRYFLSTDYSHPQGIKPTVIYNTPVQGGAAEVLLVAMKLLSNEIEDQGYRDRIKPIAVIHDEIILEAHDDCSEQACNMLAESMINAMLEIFPEASTRELVEVSIGESWADK